mgnify:FL=1
MLYKLLLSVCLVSAPTVRANNEPLKPVMILSPAQCVAIHQGQDCYVDIKLSWQMPTPGEYCLFSSVRVEPLKCWQKASAGQLKREIVSSENVRFILRRPTSQEPLATQELELAWVYKKNARARSSWRMF